jgi:stage III sporulation protein SpoIIIAA
VTLKRQATEDTERCLFDFLDRALQVKRPCVGRLQSRRTLTRLLSVSVYFFLYIKIVVVDNGG